MSESISGASQKSPIAHEQPDENTVIECIWRLFDPFQARHVGNSSPASEVVAKRKAKDVYEALRHLLPPLVRESGWQPMETAPKGYDGQRFHHILFKAVSKAGSFSGPVYISGWMDDKGKPVTSFSYALRFLGWKELSEIEGQ